MASISDDSSALLLARIEDAVRLCEKRSCPRFVGFLDERQQAEARALLVQKGCDNFRFNGGFPDAERTVLGVFPDYADPEEEDFPFMTIGFSYRESASLTHRDFLGSVLSAGIRRDKVGDILCHAGQAVLFVMTDVADFVCQNVEKIGGEGVRVTRNYDGPLPVAHEFKTWEDTVASPRLDAVLKVMIGASREEASRRIVAGQVSVDHFPCTEPARVLTQGAVISVRGEGRFVLDAIGPETRKGRLFVTVRKFL